MIKNAMICLYCLLKSYMLRYSDVYLFILGMLILMCGIEQLSLAAAGEGSGNPGGSGGSGGGEAGKLIAEQLCKIMNLIQGPFGALVTVVAGLAAVVTAAMGGYKLAMSCVVIACGSYIIAAFTELFFPGVIKDGGCENTLTKSTQ